MEFSVGQEASPAHDARFEKPLGSRGVLRHMFGDYPVADMRFAESEALATRLVLSHLEPAQLPQGAQRGTVDVSLTDIRNQPQPTTARLKLDGDSRRVTSIQFLDSNQNTLKQVRYEYDEEGGMPQLRRQEVFLAEQTVLFGFRGEGVKVRLNGTTNVFRDLPMTHLKGGRRCTIQ